ncbi:MAG: type IV pilus twitching motility protein PilT [Clostridia bacterium]
MNIIQVLQKSVELKGTDLHITVGIPPMIRVNGHLEAYGDQRLTQEDTADITRQILNEDQMEVLVNMGEVDLSYVIPNVSRFRVNAYKQRGSYSLAIRIIWMKIPTIDELGFPQVFKDLAMKPRGLVLVTGPTGSGKSTTLATLVNHINQNRRCHVLTLEEPIEYLHRHGESIINQREIGMDSKSFVNALRAALREDPDVILVGEMRDLETIATAITAAETGHLVLSTLHTTGAAQSIDRIIDVFPPYQQQQIRIQLSAVLEGIVSQQLIARADGRGVVAAFEIMLANNAISNLVREGKTHQIPTVMQTNLKAGMRMMDYSLSELVRSGMITRENAITRCVDIEMLQRYMMSAGTY